MEYVSEAPYPPNEEINNMGEFKIFNITKSEFEAIWCSYPNKYHDKFQEILRIRLENRKKKNI